MAYTWKKQASSAYGLSLTQLVLNSVMFAEELPEQYEDWMDYQKQTDRRVILLIKEVSGRTGYFGRGKGSAPSGGKGNEYSNLLCRYFSGV